VGLYSRTGGKRGKVVMKRVLERSDPTRKDAQDPRGKIARMWDYNPTKSASFARAFNPN